MPTKRILVLANSIKKDARCVAGREIIIEGGETRVGPWIRPVSGLDEGELLGKHYALAGGGKASVLDIVDVFLLGPKTDPGQPENWLIDENVTWSKVQTYDVDGLHGLAESPSDLWLEDDTRPERLTVTAQRGWRPLRSLSLIVPQNFRVRMLREFNPFKGYTQRKTRAVFEYNGQEYVLSITDPVFSAFHCNQHPPEGAEAVEIEPPCGDNCFLCVSLTPPFQGYHYKVVATVLELP